ncbi:hypothetical protein EDM56_00585 [Brevibacillus fluminis]|uniref:SH3 domain-containing protein n=1 Tax=Brevibacillus fluminis TaxID=511487 RepID=A0A3M8DX12_9BACL|nr:hypothetical protein [Brevibacillus fluminis]RNB92676.1 hypothetical protein EDM56_00585 [Brevibacillus fluminis]
MRRWFIGLLTLLLLFSLTSTVSAESFERVYLHKVMDSDSKALIVRANGDMYMIQYGVGVISIWRYEGKTVYISSPGLFAGVGSKIILPDVSQEARIWNSTFVENINLPTTFPIPPSPILPQPTPQDTSVTPIYGITVVIIAVEKAPVLKDTVNTPENLIGFLPYGTPLELDAVNLSEWYAAIFGKSILYVSKNHTTSFKTIAPKGITIKSEKGYLFTIPSANGKSIGSFVKNTKLVAIGENGNFWFILYPNSDGSFIVGFISKSIAY